MDELAPQRPSPAHPRVREDDARGAKPGTATTPQPHGGRIGQAPFVATEAQRAQVRDLAKTFPLQGERYIARLMGISRDTLRAHFADDMELGRAQMLAAIGAQMISRAINVDGKGNDGTPIAKGDLDAQKFILARLGGWSLKTEVTGRDGGPVQHAVYDLSGLSDEEKRAALVAIDKISAIAEAAGDGDAP